MNTQTSIRLGTCPVCNGTGHMPCLNEQHRKYGKRDGWFGYREEDDTMNCTNCGSQYMFGKSTGKVRLRSDNEQPCVHEYKGRNTGRCLTTYDCEHCGDRYQIDSGD